MKITIEGEPKEIAALELALKDDKKEPITVFLKNCLDSQTISASVQKVIQKRVDNKQENAIPTPQMQEQHFENQNLPDLLTETAAKLITIANQLRDVND